MLGCIIIDDEQNNILNLQLLLQKYCDDISILATAINAEEGESIIKQHKPDVVFLDIQMPAKNGFQLLQSLPKLDFEIIFVTAYDQYGIQAVKFAALDYLLKPIKTEELQKAVKKAREKSLIKKQNMQLQNLMELFKQPNQKEDQRIALPSNKEIRFVKTGSIIRCESSNNYTTFHLDNGEKILVSRPIYEYEELLAGYGFIRCHQSHLLNKKFIESWLKKDGDYLLLGDGTEVPVSRQKREMVKKELVQ